MDKAATLSNREWLSTLLRKTRLSPPGIFLLFLIINLLTTIPVAFYFGAWSPGNISKGLSREPAALLNDDLAIPLILAYFHWIQYAGDHLFKTLTKEGILTNSGSIRSILTRSSKRLQSSWAPMAATITGLIFSIYFISTFTQPRGQGFISWVFVNPAIVWIRAPMLFITIYALVMFVYDLGIIVITLNALFRSQTIKLEPLHPDGAGGLASIGHFVSSLGYFLFIIGFAYSIRIIQQNVVDSSGMDDIVTFVGLGIYLLLAPLIFFLPLQSARRAMILSRNNLLMDISKEFDTTFTEIHKLRSEKADHIEPLLQRHRQIEEIHRIVEKFPVWPFNLGNIRQFFSLVLIPILPALISIAVDLLKK